MSRRKSKQRVAKRPPRPSAAPTPGSRRRIILVLGAVLVAVGVAWLWMRPTPGRLYRQAREVFPQSPARADALLEQSVELAGGDYPAAQILRCRALARLDRWLEATGCLGTIQDPAAVPADDLVALGREAEAAGQIVLCRLAFLALARGESKHRAKALQRLAVIDYESGQVIQSLKHATQLQQVAPSDAIGWFIEGRIRHENVELAEAAAAFRKAVEHCEAPEFCRSIREELIDVLIEVGETAEAREHIDALREGGLSDKGRLLAARLDRLEGRADQALATLQELRGGADVDAQEVLLLSGLLHLDRGEPAQAAKYLEQVVRKDRFHQEAHARLATAYELMGDSNSAEQHATRSRELQKATLRILELQQEIGKQGERAELVEEMASLYETIGRNDLAERLRAAMPEH